MRSFWGFVWICLKEAVRHNRAIWEISSIWLAFFLAVLSSIFRHFSVPSMEGVLSDLVWEVPVGLLAMVTVVRLAVSPYWVYQELRTEGQAKVDELNKTVTGWNEIFRPKIDLKCGPQIAGSVVSSAGGYDFDSTFRVVVTSLGFNVLGNCQGRLREIRRDGKQVWGCEEMPLTFVVSGNRYETRHQLDPKLPSYLEVVGVKDGKLKIAVNSNQRTLGAADSEIQRKGEYSIIIALAAQNTVSIEAELTLIWTGEFNTSSLTLVKQHALGVPI